jgi:hypothetical protein
VQILHLLEAHRLLATRLILENNRLKVERARLEVWLGFADRNWKNIWLGLQPQFLALPVCRIW